MFIPTFNMSMITVQNLQHTPLPTIVAAFQSAFADYAVAFNDQEIYAILERRGFDSSYSFAAFKDNQIVGFTLNGIGQMGGKLSAYDTGTGVVIGHRGKGLASKIFQHSLPFLKEKGIEQYVLEVLTGNAPAISVYRNLGFEINRNFNCFRNDKPETLPHASSCIITTCAIENVFPCAAYQEIEPSWQNNFDALERAGEQLVCLVAEEQHKIVGYCVFDPTTGDLSNIAVAPHFRRQGIGSRLLNEFYLRKQTEGVKCLNIDDRDTTLSAFLQKNGFKLICQQYEMLRKI